MKCCPYPQIESQIRYFKYLLSPATRFVILLWTWWEVINHDITDSKRWLLVAGLSASLHKNGPLHLY